MRKAILAMFVVALTTWVTSCTNTEVEYLEPIISYDTTTVVTPAGHNRFVYEDLFVLNEGNFQSDNGQMSLFSGKTLSITNGYFKSVNGFKLGDTPNDIIQVNDTLYAITVIWSNIIQFIRPDGTACGATEDIPNNRQLCTDDKGFIYVTSYAHVCGTTEFTKGYVAKIDPATKKVVGACEVGWEPEGVKWYNGKLYVMNSGGYAFSESHSYENSISIVDSETMTLVNTVQLEQDGVKAINLYGDVSQIDNYLCISSAGDYYSNPARTVIFNCDDNSYKIYNFSSTLNTVCKDEFIIVGSSFSYNTGQYEYTVCKMNPKTGEVTSLDKELEKNILKLTAPYAIYCSPYTNNLYVTDALNYGTSGKLYVFNSYGASLNTGAKTYINPGEIIAVPHYEVETEYTTTITVTPHVTYPAHSPRSTYSAYSSRPAFNVDEYNRTKFIEAWSKSTK